MHEKFGFFPNIFFFLPDLGIFGYILLVLQIFCLIVAILRCYLACTAHKRHYCYLCVESDMNAEEWERHRRPPPPSGRAVVDFEDLPTTEPCPMWSRYLACEVSPVAKCGKCQGPMRKLWE